MSTIDYGVFTPYDDPTDAAHVLHMRNEAAKDWYDFIAEAPRADAWLLADRSTGEVVCATDDPSKLAPIGARVLAASGLTPASYVGKVWNGVDFIAKPKPAPTSITRRQCALEMRAREMATDAEAIALVATGALTAAMASRLSLVAPGSQLEAQIDAAIDPYRRDNANLCALICDTNKLDAFFLSASKR